MTKKSVECFGGPMDGKTMELDADVGEDICMLHLDHANNRPYFYVTVMRDKQLVLDYAGESPYDAVNKLRVNGCSDADEIEERLDSLWPED
jgi:hypothetical protein